MIKGEWGTGLIRRNKLKNAGYDFNKIQNENNILSPNSARKADNIQIIKDTLPHDEPGLYHGFGFFSFATATL